MSKVLNLQLCTSITTFIFSHSYILNLRLDSLANPFHHRPFPVLCRTDSTGDSCTFNIFILLNGCMCLHGVFRAVTALGVLD